VGGDQEKAFKSTPELDSSGYSSRTVMWLFGNMILIPVRAFIYGMEMLVKTMQGMQNATDRSLGVIAGGDSANSGGGGDAAAGSGNTGQPVVPGGVTIGTELAHTQTVRDHETTGKGSAKMPDTNLNDDMLKLVRYKILFIKRTYEFAFKEKDELVRENRTDSAFTAWKIAEFVQSLDRIEVPETWKEYPEGRTKRDGKEYISDLGDDKKFLRVYFEVLQRYAREKLLYEEDQLAALKGIRQAILERGLPPAGAVAEAGKHK